MNLFGLKVAKSSFQGHVEDADLSQLAFDSTKPIPKILVETAITITTTNPINSSGIAVYHHGLGYAPHFLLYAEISKGSPRVVQANTRALVAGFSDGSSSGGAGQPFIAWSDNNDIKVWQNDTDTNLYHGYLYIFADEVGLS